MIKAQFGNKLFENLLFIYLPSYVEKYCIVFDFGVVEM